MNGLNKIELEAKRKISLGQERNNFILCTVPQVTIEYRLMFRPSFLRPVPLFTRVKAFLFYARTIYSCLGHPILRPVPHVEDLGGRKVDQTPRQGRGSYQNKIDLS